jgi:type IV secretory pathway VirB4 component
MAHENSKKLLEDMTGRNQKLFSVTVTMMLIADSKEELEKDKKLLDTALSKHLCQATTYAFLQEQGFATTLPLANNQVETDIFLKTECSSIFIPFVAEEMHQKGGICYGVNPLTNNLIVHNRMTGQNYNGMILGKSGSGKSFTSKKEILNVYLSTDDDIIIIDPENEYSALAELLKGEVIQIASGTGNYINPLDMDMEYEKDGTLTADPVTIKSDYICSIFETITKSRFGLTATEVAIIDRCTRNIYRGYLDHMETYNGSCDREASPLLADLFDELRKQPEPEAYELATSLELYALGSQDIFSKRTNVDLNNRLTVYNIHKIGSTLQTLGLQVCLNDAWNKIIQNFSKGKKTWLVIDEIHLLLVSDGVELNSSATNLKNIYKRARKFRGIPTGMTQDIEDMLKSGEARAILNNCDFVMLLNQSPLGRSELSTIFNISDEQLEYITSADPGCGLLIAQEKIIPFIDHFPEDTRFFKVMTTKIDDIE